MGYHWRNEIAPTPVGGRASRLGVRPSCATVCRERPRVVLRTSRCFATTANLLKAILRALCVKRAFQAYGVRPASFCRSASSSQIHWPSGSSGGKDSPPMATRFSPSARFPAAAIIRLTRWYFPSVVVRRSKRSARISQALAAIGAGSSLS